MAIRGISREEIYPYVPVDDRDSPVNEQTVFYIRPKKLGDSNRTAVRYMQTKKSTSRSGYEEYDANKMEKADVEEFISIVEKVENYIWSTDHGDGITPVTVENPDDLRKLCRDMPPKYLNEIVEASSDISKLKEGEKKSLNSSPTSTSGNQKKKKEEESMTVISVKEQD